MAILYTNVGAVEAGNINILANLDDPNLSCARLSLITATYTMTGAEIQNDLIYIKRVPSGSLVDPTSTVAGDGVMTDSASPSSPNRCGKTCPTATLRSP